MFQLHQTVQTVWSYYVLTDVCDLSSAVKPVVNQCTTTMADYCHSAHVQNISYPEFDAILLITLGKVCSFMMYLKVSSSANMQVNKQN